MTLSGFQQFQKSQPSEPQTFYFNVAPLFCQNCVDRIATAFERNGLQPMGIRATHFGNKESNKESNKEGTLEVIVDSNTSRETITELLKKAGRNVNDEGAPSNRKKFG